MRTNIYRHLRGTEASVDVVLITPDDVERYGDSPCLVIYSALHEGKVVYVEPNRWQVAELPALPPEEPLLDEVPEPLREWVGQAHDYALLAEDRSQLPRVPFRA